MSLFSLISVCSCSANNRNQAEENETENASVNQIKETQDMNKEGKKLVTFFSHTGENYNVGYIEEGNTHIIAQMISDATGADIWEIAPLKPYPVNYNECIDVAKKELNANARPAIQGDIDIEEYDVIFLGYPNWWGEPPMCIYTFIEKHNWDGKTVIPFITHEGSGMAGTDKRIANACKGANVLTGKGLAIQGKVAQEHRDVARSNVDSWLKGLGFTE